MADLTAINTLLTTVPPVALRGRTRAAIAIECSAIMSEDTGTANHTQRLAWAGAVLGNLEFATTKVFTLLMSNATIVTAGDSATDDAVTTAVATVCTMLSGVSGNL